MKKVPYVRIHFPFKDSNRSINAQEIARVILQEIEQGKLPPQCRLPPVRVLAHQLGISKNTVQVAYEELVDQGKVENRERLGFFIQQSEKVGLENKSMGIEPALPPLFQSSFKPRMELPDDVIPLSQVFIDPEILPKKKLSECFKSVLNLPGIPAFYDQQGFPPLREKIAERLSARGIPARAEDVIITTGSQQALSIVCHAMVNKKIATENPAYSIARVLFEVNKMEATGLPLNPFEGGIDLEEWEKRIAKNRPEMLYLTSSFQNPTGHSYTTSDMLKLLELSQKYQFGIIEDDWGSDMLSYSEFRPPMRALGGEKVFYMNSFTKKLLPSLRIGYLLGNPKSTGSLVRAKWASTLGNPTLIEAALFEFLDRGYYDTHLKKIQGELDDRYQNCIETLKALMPEGVTWSTPGGGPILWLEIPKEVDLPKLKDRLYERKVWIALSDDAFWDTPHLHGFRLGYSFLSKEKLIQALEILADELNKG